MRFNTTEEVKSRILNHTELFLKDPLATVRTVASITGWTKSTVYLDIAERLAEVDGDLHKVAVEKLLKNKELRSVRGGASTQNLFRRIREENNNADLS